MEIIKSISDYKKWRDKKTDLKLGFVPTMGALHLGHASLINKAKKENDLVVLSIFVNPTQFNDPKDFELYPNTWEHDIELARSLNVDVLFAPDHKEIYGDQFKFQILEKDFSHLLCGAHRPGHFTGVLTVVSKLFNIVKPHSAYFGEKDFQQVRLIEEMTKAFFIPIKIVRCPTVREPSGLAMSSRNQRLSHEGLKKAPEIYKIIKSPITEEECRRHLVEAGFKLDYVADLDSRRYVAVFLEGLRLIDNVEI